MEQPLKYIINEDPIAWARARLSRGRFFDAQKQEKLYYGLLISNIHGDRPMYDGPLRLDVTFFMPIPKGMSEKKRLEMEGKWHDKRPDRDNLLKFLKDLCTGILYKDDCLICTGPTDKVYSCKPRIEFSITELK